MPSAPDPEWAKELWRRLQPDAIRVNLVRAGLFLAGWEMLKGEIQERVREFYLMIVRDVTPPDIKPDPVLLAAYRTEVLSRHPKCEFEASLLWLVESSALTEPQAESARRLRQYRNEVAHELPKLILEPGCDVDMARIQELHEVVTALGRFWAQIEIDINSEFDGKDVDPASIRSGAVLIMDLVLAAASEEGTARTGATTDEGKGPSQ